MKPNLSLHQAVMYAKSIKFVALSEAESEIGVFGAVRYQTAAFYGQKVVTP